MHYGSYEYISIDGTDFFTAFLLPDKIGKFPTVVCRSPYVFLNGESEDELIASYLEAYSAWLSRGYAVVFQHCRGCGKSNGAFVPYVHEREDGLFLLSWIRSRTFYNNELFLLGGSYTSSLHYTIAPFQNDIKGAVFEVQDSERYRLWYRNGQMRKGHANWHFILYKNNCGLNKSHTMASFSELPLKGLSKRVLGEEACDFEQMLDAPRPTDEFWNTRLGGAEARNVTDHANIPMLFTTGYNDFYVGGIFKMWQALDKTTKSQCALLVSPYNHGDTFSGQNGLSFKDGSRAEHFGSTYQIDWFDSIRKGTPLPYKKGEITYYRTFEDTWQTSFYQKPVKDTCLTLGTQAASFCYDPLDPPFFGEEGTFLQDHSQRTDVISLCTPPFDRDVFVKGQMKALLTVSSSCEDTSFYVNVSIKKPQGDYILRHDITSLCYQLDKYTKNQEASLNFCFDEHAFAIKKGEQLRVDISSTDNNTYVCHTNQKGAYSLQSKAQVATNTVYLDKSMLILPLEE